MTNCVHCDRTQNSQCSHNLKVRLRKHSVTNDNVELIEYVFVSFVQYCSGP